MQSCLRDGGQRPAAVRGGEEAVRSDPERAALPVFVGALIFVLALFVHLAGLWQDLPYAGHIDEEWRIFVTNRMVTTNNLHPYSFGHPGSTVLYPVAAMGRLYAANLVGKSPLEPIPEITEILGGHPTILYVFGRTLSCLYATIAIWLVYVIGTRLKGMVVGLLASWFCIFTVVSVEHAQYMRTDGASMAYIMLALLACLWVYEKPDLGRHLVAGVTLGLAVSTKYYLGAAAVALVVASLTGGKEQGDPLLAQLGRIALCALVAALTFLATTPYFVIDFSKALADLRGELRSEHLGADGLGVLGNLAWYLTQGIAAKNALGWPRTVLAIVGGTALVIKRRPAAMPLVAFCVAFVVGISFGSLHWQRWLIPVFPVLNLFAAWGLVEIVESLRERLSLLPRHQALMAGLVVLAISVAPASQLTRHTTARLGVSTRLRARDWILCNIDSGAQIARERYSGPLKGARYEELLVFTLTEHDLDWYKAEGYQYLQASSAIYNRYLAEPERYAHQAAFYTRLFHEGTLLAEFGPTRTSEGSVVRIYDISTVAD